MNLSELSRAELQAPYPAIEPDGIGALSLRVSMPARDILGGTASAQVMARIRRHRERLG